MTISPTRIPLRPDFSARSRPADHLFRAVLAEARARYDLGLRGAARIAASCWPDDKATEFLITRAATAPATSTTSGWAAELARSAVADLIVSLGPASAASELLRRAMVLSFDNSAQINVPAIVSVAADSPFFAEGSPIPIRQFVIGAGATLVLKKFGVGFSLTRETIEHSTPAAERLVRAAVTESVGIALDTALLDATAASATRPAGIRNGVTVTTATAGGTVDAMMKDLGNLAQAVSAVGGTQIAFI